MTTPCPFCGAGWKAGGDNVSTLWHCGTIGPDNCDEYVMSAQCESTMYRRAYLRCLDLLSSVVASNTTFDHEGHIVVMLEGDLLRKILLELDDKQSEVPHDL